MHALTRLAFRRIGDAIRRFMARQALEAQLPVPGDVLSEGNRRRARLHAAAAQPDIDLHHHAGRDAERPRRLRERIDLHGIIDQRDDLGAAGQAHQPRQLVRPDDLLDHADAARPGRDHDLGLAHLGAGKPVWNRALRRHLQLRDRRAFMALRHAAHLGRAVAKEPVHHGDVAFEHR